MKKQLFITRSAVQAGIRQFGRLLLLFLTFLATQQAAVSQNITRPNISGPGGLQVNSYTGGLFYQRTDLQIPGPGISLDIAFAYNSADRAKDEGYGYGWTFRYNLGYSSDSSGLTFRKGDGRRDRYVVYEIAYLAPKGVFDVLLQYAPGKYKLVTKDNTEYYFDDPGHKKLTSVKDRNGNTLTMAYADGHLISITDGSNRSVTFAWTNNRLTEARSAAGNPARVITYQYNSAGCLASVKNAGGYTTSYTYGPGRLMTAMTDWNGNTVNIAYNGNRAVSKLLSCQSEKNISYNASQRKTYLIEKNGDKNLITTYEFDTEGRLINKEGNCCGFKTSYSYDANNNINRVIDANGNTSLYTYDAKGNQLTETDPSGRISRFTWDIILSRITSITDKKGNRTNYTYDSKGNLTSVSDALNQVVQFTYDNKGNRLTHKDARNFTTSYSYDQQGYPATRTDAGNGITRYTYDSWGNMLSVTDPNNHTTQYTYDALNRIQTITNAANGKAQYTYDNNGNLISITDPNNNITRYTYDPHNNLIVKTDALDHIARMAYDAMNNLTSSTDANGKTTSYQYDNLNRLIAETNPAGEVLQYTYDGNGNRLSVRYPNGNILRVQYDALSRATTMSDQLGPVASYTYDANGNRLSETDGNGNTTTFRFNALNRATTITDALGNTTTYIYDANSNLAKEIDRNNNNTLYSYDALNRLTTFTDALGYVTKRTYDAVGNLVSLTDAKNNVTTFHYDALNRNTDEIFADNTKKTYAYDAAGNLLNYTDNNGQTTSFTYDKLSRPVLRQYPSTADTLNYDAIGNLQSANNPFARISFTYDGVYRITSETLNGHITGYAYNTASDIEKIIYPGGKIIERQANPRGYLKTLKDGNSLIAQFDYNASNLVINKRYINNTSSSFDYNGNRQLTNLNVNPSRFIDMGFGYDKQGNLTRSEYRHNPANSEQYLYDNLNQLKEFHKGELRPSIYSYDGTGNRTAIQLYSVPAIYQTNSTNAYTDIFYGHQTRPTYDANGNMTSFGSNKYTYDTENRIISINDGLTAEYSYDALGRRIKKKTGNIITNYFYDGLQVIEERSASDVLQATYVWGTWLDDIVSMDRDNQTYYYHTNQIGSVIAITDVAGKIAERYEYDGFGKVSFYNKTGALTSASEIGNTYTYTGRQYEAESGLFYYRKRHYDPVHGRFLQRDPLDFVDNANKYTYVLNSPNNWVDPEGTSPTLITAGIGAGIGAIVGGGWTLWNGGTWAEAGRSAARGAIAGGVAGLTLGVGGGAIAGYFGGGIIGGAAAGGVAGGAGDLAAQGYDYATQDCFQFNWKELGYSVGLGGLFGGAGSYFRPPTAPGPGLNLRPDIVRSGGRGGGNVRDLTGPANSVIKGSPGRIYITDDAGNVIWDITKKRAKPITPGRGAGSKETPTQDQLDLINKIWGNE